MSERIGRQEGCPECLGHGVYAAFAHTADGGDYRTVPCGACNGTGMVAAGYAARLAFGESVRIARIQARLKLRDAAPHLGLSPAGLSAIEFGRKDWRP